MIKWILQAWHTQPAAKFQTEEEYWVLCQAPVLLIHLLSFTIIRCDGENAWPSYQSSINVMKFHLMLIYSIYLCKANNHLCNGINKQTNHIGLVVYVHPHKFFFSSSFFSVDVSSIFLRMKIQFDSIKII